MIAWENYRITDPDAVTTPAMLLFDDIVEHNIRSACELAGGSQNLFPHVKTHKSDAITRRQIAMGIRSFKCATGKELEMVLEAGAQKAILAYPQIQPPKVERLLDAVAAYPEAWIATIASSRGHVEMLGTIAANRKQPLAVMLDLDPGMHRTGIRVDDNAVALYRKIVAHPALEAAGLHCYDGHDSISDAGKREAAAQAHIRSLQWLRSEIETAGMPVPTIVAGGAYSFPYYSRSDGMYGSPGSFIYWDARCRSHMPDTPFQYAALILAQVVDRHQERGTFTTDLGYKSICADQPLDERVRLLGHDAAQLVMHSEEYGVFRLSGKLPDIGDYLLAVPWHIGPTTIRYPGSYLVDAAGSVIDFIEHTARDRA